MLSDDLLYQVVRPGQYLGNEWGACRKEFTSCDVHLCLAFPDLYELGMSNFGQRILYQIVNRQKGFMADRTYAPDQDMETLLRARALPLWAWESRHQLADFELLGFSLQYELTFTNLLNMLDLAGMEVEAAKRTALFPLVFGGGPSAVNPEPMSLFMDFFVIGDGEESVPKVMEIVRDFKKQHPNWQDVDQKQLKAELLHELARKVHGIYVPSLYEVRPGVHPVAPRLTDIPLRVLRQVQPLTDDNQPSGGLVPYLALVHDRQVLEVRRGCDRGCRFCQPGYTFLPVRERSAEDLVRLSKEAIANTGYEEYSMLSLCVSDYTSLHESVRALNREHTDKRTSMSFPSQRADRMNLDLAEELKAVRKSGITLAPEAGSERLRKVINKGLSHEQILNAIESAYASGWTSIKLYYMIGLPTERDEDLQGILDTLLEASERCRAVRRKDPQKHKRDVEFTCTISNFVPKPFTPFQWFGQVSPAEFSRKQQYLREKLKESRLFRNVMLNCTGVEISLLESVISRGDRRVGDLILSAWRKGCTFDAWDDRFVSQRWHEAAADLGMDLVSMATTSKEVGSKQPWDIVHVGLADWWLKKEWEKSENESETATCTEHTCHACGICTELDATHQLADPNPEVMKKNPFVKEIPVTIEKKEETHPSLYFEAVKEPAPQMVSTRIRFQFNKTGDLKFISHLDLQNLFIRAARRAEIPMAYSEGFNPGPKLSIALSLPLHVEALAELAELELTEDLAPADFIARMNSQLPAEAQISAAVKVDKTLPALTTFLSKACYTATLPVCNKTDPTVLKAAVDHILSQTTIVVEESATAKKTKRGGKKHGTEEKPKNKDIRPHIFNLAVSGQEPITVDFCISHGPKHHLKPMDLLKLICAEAPWKLTRTALLADDGRTLLDAGKASPSLELTRRN
ncbi:MAG: TIGR03960 family B12-binding radical SAM protein [Candidatus Obscuribacterales bacterium]|nr:TIGR03960 family B12-binding radical SAM protein [Candidatus Obscuribacterales bacterium]